MNILIVNSNPDRGAPRFSDALIDTYAAAARGAGHTVDTLNVSELQFPLLRGKSARIVVTMGMPAFVYRRYFGTYVSR